MFPQQGWSCRHISGSDFSTIDFPFKFCILSVTTGHFVSFSIVDRKTSAMIKSYFTTAFRNLWRNKIHSSINILGLSIGLAVCFLAFMFILDEISFDQFHSNKDRLYRLNKINLEENGAKSLTAESSGMMGPTMVSEFPEVESVVRYAPQFNDVVLSYQDKNIVTSGGELAFVDSTFFDVFDFKLLRGNSKEALRRPLTIVITDKLAQTLFGKEDPMGKTIMGFANLEYEITGIAEEPPRNSHIQFNALMSWTTTVQPLQFDFLNNWIAQALCTYVLLKPQADQKTLEAKFPKFMQDHMPTRVDKYQLYLQPFNDLYLQSTNISALKMVKTGSQAFINLFSITAGLILLIACINYINISTSKATRRAREVGMRKTLGANKIQLVKQFLGESFLQVVFSCILGLALLYMVVPYFNELTGKSIPLSILFNPYVAAAGILTALLVAGLSGFYPAYILSSFQPAAVLKTSAKSSLSGNLPRYVLITFQFTITIMMIAGTLIVFEQIRYILQKNLGFDKEHVLVMSLTEALVDKKDVLQNDVNGFQNVVSTSVSATSLGRGTWSSYVIPEGHTAETEMSTRMFPVDGNFKNTYGLEMAMGKFFDTTLSSDSNSVIINETMMHKLGWTDATKMTIKFNEGQPSVPIIGVLKDFHYKSLYEEIEPLVMWISPDNQNKMSVRFTGNPASLISFLETKWKKYESRYPFEYTFVDQAFAQNYQAEEKLLKTIVTFAVLSIIIACLGLYGLVSFTIEQRTREFGIRKVMGASVASINYLVNRKFVLMVLLASVVAIPIMIPIMKTWLAKFAVKIEIGVMPMALAVIITLAVSLLAVSIQAVKAARQNPIDSLKYE